MEHIRIHQGHVVVGRDGDVERFSCEREAAAHAAYEIVQKGRVRAYDTSCDFPALNGRPGFNKAVFESLLDAEIARVRGSVRSLAA